MKVVFINHLIDTENILDISEVMLLEPNNLYYAEFYVNFINGDSRRISFETLFGKDSWTYLYKKTQGNRNSLQEEHNKAIAKLNDLRNELIKYWEPNQTNIPIIKLL